MQSSLTDKQIRKRLESLTFDDEGGEVENYVHTDYRCHYDPKKNIIGAVHAGWKGAYKKIVKKMIKYFKKEGSKLNNIIAVIGPCISQNSYEIKNDFKIRFLNESLKNRKHFKTIRSKIYFDLRGYIFRQLKNAGINNIEIIKKDTFNPKNNFFSARRSLKKKINDYGRNISIIMIK